MLYDINVKSVDLNSLREQKSALLELQYRMGSDGNSIVKTKEFEALEGIINLIDSIQDQAVEQHGLSEEDVYNFKEE